MNILEIIKKPIFQYTLLGIIILCAFFYFKNSGYSVITPKSIVELEKQNKELFDKNKIIQEEYKKVLNSQKINLDKILIFEKQIEELKIRVEILNEEDKKLNIDFKTNDDDYKKNVDYINNSSIDDIIKKYYGPGYGVHANKNE